MARPTLEGVPRHELPAGFSVRRYRPGDEDLWTQIWMTADIYNAVNPETFGKEFGDHAETLPERQFFLCDAGGEAIGTATAWFGREDVDGGAGLVHWVAIRPQMQGLGLAKPLMTIVLERLTELGYDRAYLITQEARLAAINLYLEMGFVPRVRSDEERAAWLRVRGHLRGSRLDGIDLDG